ncbi:hypothetical protein ACIBCT_37460 [Streptosporangium sp. NPDC050855]|uniref:hypothetical protein n=1 Tax=Streptosporangium sp. NPDC050855 TaxID=3366194 RepID=UPI0037A9CC56
MTASLAQVADDIAAALHDRDLHRARAAFDRAVHDNQAALQMLLKELAATVEIGAGTVVVGFGIDVWANPYRDGYAWRCGCCRWSGSNYLTAPAARRAANKHADEHKQSRPTVCDSTQTLNTTPTARGDTPNGRVA